MRSGRSLMTRRPAPPAHQAALSTSVGKRGWSGLFETLSLLPLADLHGKGGIMLVARDIARATLHVSGAVRQIDGFHMRVLLTRMPSPQRGVRAADADQSRSQRSSSASRYCAAALKKKSLRELGISRETGALACEIHLSGVRHQITCRVARAMSLATSMMLSVQIARVARGNRVSKKPRPAAFADRRAERGLVRRWCRAARHQRAPLTASQKFLCRIGRLVGETGFEPATPWSQRGKRRITWRFRGWQQLATGGKPFKSSKPRLRTQWQKSASVETQFWCAGGARTSARSGPARVSDHRARRCRPPRLARPRSTNCASGASWHGLRIGGCSQVQIQLPSTKYLGRARV